MNSISLVIGTTVDVTYTKEIVPTAIPTPTPIPVPTPAPITFTISPSAITATHTVGVSLCPQLLGTIKVKNTGSNSISVILPAVSDLELSTTGFVLAAGEEKDVTVKFTCANFPPLTKTVTFYLAPTTSGAATRTSDVTVQLNAG